MLCTKALYSTPKLSYVLGYYNLGIGEEAPREGIHLAARGHRPLRERAPTSPPASLCGVLIWWKASQVGGSLFLSMERGCSTAEDLPCSMDSEIYSVGCYATEIRDTVMILISWYACWSSNP
jgi:hypothetical protein